MKDSLAQLPRLIPTWQFFKSLIIHNSLIPQFLNPLISKFLRKDIRHLPLYQDIKRGTCLNWHRHWPRPGFQGQQLVSRTSRQGGPGYVFINREIIIGQAPSILPFFDMDKVEAVCYLLTGCCLNPFSLGLKHFWINLRLAPGDWALIFRFAKIY